MIARCMNIYDQYSFLHLWNFRTKILIRLTKWRSYGQWIRGNKLVFANSSYFNEEIYNELGNQTEDRQWIFMKTILFTNSLSLNGYINRWLVIKDHMATKCCWQMPCSIILVTLTKAVWSVRTLENIRQIYSCYQTSIVVCYSI